LFGDVNNNIVFNLINFSSNYLVLQLNLHLTLNARLKCQIKKMKESRTSTFIINTMAATSTIAPAPIPVATTSDAIQKPNSGASKAPKVVKVPKVAKASSKVAPKTPNNTPVPSTPTVSPVVVDTPTTDAPVVDASISERMKSLATTNAEHLALYRTRSDELRAQNSELTKLIRDHTKAVREASKGNKTAKKQVEADSVESPEQPSTIADRLQEMISRNTAQSTVLRSQMDTTRAQNTEITKLIREHEKAIREAGKKQKKVKAPRDYSKVRKPAGFAEPLLVSDKLYGFLTKTKAEMKDPSFVPKNEEEDRNWPRIPVKSGQPVARTDVTSHISKYIKQKDLQNPENKREIFPDAELKKIFSDSETYQYLQLQKYVNHHFQKKVQATST
jgi:hypothetical protein